MGPRLTLLDAPEGVEENCYIDTPLAVAGVLRAAAAAGARAAAYFDNDRRFIHTSLLGITGEPPMVAFERGPDPESNIDLQRSGRFTFVTSDHGVPVQFNGLRLSMARWEGREVFVAPLPSRLLRLQRRGYYRLPGEPSQSLMRCELHRSNGSSLTAAVLDVSGGGLSAALPIAEPLIDPQEILGCVLELPGEGPIHSPATIRLVTSVFLPSGLEATRYGLKFIDLPEHHCTTLQRYIIAQQRTRRAANRTQ